jgi:hypothetical protein
VTLSRRKSRWRLGVDRESDSLLTFGAIDVGIGSRIDDSAPPLRRDHPRNRARIFQVECGPTWRNNVNIR